MGVASFDGGVLLTPNYTEAPQPIVHRTEMDSGIAKQTPFQSTAYNNIECEYVFTDAEYTGFVAWYKTTARYGSAFFNWLHHRTGGTVDARLLGGAYKARPTTAKATQWNVTFTLETLL